MFAFATHLLTRPKMCGRPQPSEARDANPDILLAQQDVAWTPTVATPLHTDIRTYVRVRRDVVQHTATVEARWEVTDETGRTNGADANGDRD